MDTSDLLSEIAIFMDDDEFDVFYERLMNRFDWLGPNEFDSMCCKELDKWVSKGLDSKQAHDFDVEVFSKIIDNYIMKDEI